MLLYDVPFSTKKTVLKPHPSIFIHQWNTLPGLGDAIPAPRAIFHQHWGDSGDDIVKDDSNYSNYSYLTLQKRLFFCVFFRLCPNQIGRVVTLVSVCHATIRMIDAVISASWSFPSSWHPCPRRGPLFEKPRKTTGGPKGGFIGRREHFTYVYTVFGQLDGQVFEWFQTFFRWAKYCLASLSSSRLPTHRRVQHLISVFNNIELRLQNGPMCESTLLFRFVFFFQGRSHGFVFSLNLQRCVCWALNLCCCSERRFGGSRRSRFWMVSSENLWK